MSSIPPQFTVEDVEALHPHVPFEHGPDTVLEFADMWDFKTRFENGLPEFIDSDNGTVQDWRNRLDITRLIPAKSIPFNGRFADIEVVPIEDPLSIFAATDATVLVTNGAKAHSGEIDRIVGLPDTLKSRILGFDFSGKAYSSASSSKSEITTIRTLLMYVPVSPKFGVKSISKYREDSSRFGLRRFMTKPTGDIDAITELLEKSAVRRMNQRSRQVPGSVTQ